MAMHKRYKKNIKVFFNHTHAMPEVNLYFINIFYEIANIHFDVNVESVEFDITKAERMIRESDGFIGIYSFQQNELELKTGLLELSTAIRANKPIIVFYDNRLTLSEGFYTLDNVYSFNIKDVLNNLTTTSTTHRNLFKKFIKYINSYSEYQATKSYQNISKLVVISLIEKDIYNHRILDLIQKLLQKYDCSVKYLNNITNFLEISDLINKADWIITDINPDLQGNISPAFFFGQHIPLLRLWYVENCRNEIKSNTLVEYSENAVVWHDESQLLLCIEDRLKTIFSPLRRINSFEEAYQYFAKGLLREETVFISYTKSDRLFTKELIVELKKKFKSVIDYRDGASIFSGQDWRMQIEHLLEQSIIAIPILSKDYVQSKNCLDELSKMEGLMKNDKLIILPIKPKSDTFDLPNSIAAINYLRAWEYKSVEGLIDRIVASYIKVKQGSEK